MYQAITKSNQTLGYFAQLANAKQECLFELDDFTDNGIFEWEVGSNGVWLGIRKPKDGIPVCLYTIIPVKVIQ